MVHRTAPAAVLLLSLAFGPGVGGQEAPCAGLLASAPAAQETAKCVFSAARAEEGAGPATVLLERLAAEHLDRPWLSFYLGHLRWSDPAAARESYRRAAEGFRRAGADEDELVARINLLTQHERLNQVGQAEDEVERILAIAESSGSAKLHAWGQIVLARHLVDRGRELDRAYEILRDLEIPSSPGDTYFLHRDRLLFLGELCQLIGRFDEARDVYGRLADLAAERGDDYMRGNVSYSLATLAYEDFREAPSERNRAAAVRAAREAWSTTSAQDHPDQSKAAWLIGELVPGDEGRRFLDRCLELASNDSVRSYCLNPLAARTAKTDPHAARQMVERSRRLAAASGDPWAQIRAWQKTMQVEWAIAPPEDALPVAWRALDRVEALRNEQAGGSSVQAGAFSIWSDDFAWLAGSTLLEADRRLDREAALAAAFRASERLRARALADWLRAAATELGDSPPGRSAELREAQAELAPDEAMLSFLVAPWEDALGDFAGGSWVLAITRDAVTSHRLPGRVEVRHGVRRFEAAIAGRGDGGGREARLAADLHGDLLAEALAELPESVDRLILVPDDALHRLPFAALRASPDAEPLGARYELVQVPSATLWLRWRNAAPSPAPEPLLVFADPEPPGAVGGQRGAAIQLAAARGGSGYRSAGELFERLPHARREGRAALRALGGGLLLIGADASEAAVRRLPLRDYAVLHVAGHARNDEDRPERSMVVLAAAEGESGPASDRDGYLRSAEIARLDLAGRAVVLAACESADGSTLRGEGVMSLGRAFFQSGAHTVVASLWRLRDDDSAAMFDRFYRHLGRGESVVSALHAARVEAIEAGEPAAAWAGLVVLGDGSLVPVPGGRRGPGELLRAPATLGLAAAALVAIALAVLAARRRSRAV